MARGKVITTHLRTGDPNGIRTVFISNQICEMIVFPKSEFEMVSKMEESSRPLVSSQYWNMAYGQTPGQAAQDEEGMQTMRTLARNMAWMIRKLNVSEDGHPELESPLRTNFIR